MQNLGSWSVHLSVAKMALACTFSN